ncbi:transient receptor potential cation channel subfamily A member 1 homolog isoform X2 [Scylla paramamosain]|uniref:transient receptor potential cation channel subfamily A member 1 homolog isoform X2 n=1 Tax=Scylla paramamosain TaxID=85552 RepID=UPI003082F59E
MKKSRKKMSSNWNKTKNVYFASEELIRLLPETRQVSQTGMSAPASRKGSGSGESLYHELTDIITRTQENPKGLTTYDHIARTLFQLARNGDSVQLQAALSRLGEQGRRRINHFDKDKLTPLHYAARYAHADTVKTLIHAGARVNIQGQDDLTPLHLAARYRKQIKPNKKLSPCPPAPEEEVEEQQEEEEEEEEEQEEQQQQEEEEAAEEGNEEEQEDKEVVEANGLLEYEENAKNSVQGFQSSLEALSKDSVIRILVECGAKVNALDVYGQTPLHYAAMRGNDPAAKDLIACPEVILEAKDKQLMTPLFVAATFGNFTICKALIDAGASFFCKDESEQMALHRASMEGHLDIVELLLSSATKLGGASMVEKLVLDQDDEGQTCLHHAVNNGHYEIAKRLILAGANVNTVRDSLTTPLHAAASIGHTELIKLLLANHARLECIDSYQQTPLHKAAIYDQPAAITTLLEAGAKIERRDKDSFTPLLLAASGGHADALQTLLDNDADIEAVDKDDKTAVFWCAEQGNCEALEVLLNDPRCADLVDESDRYDNSPLHEAARRGYYNIIDKLLAAGSRIDNKNEDEETALHVAAEAGQVKVVRELMKHYRYLVKDENENSDTPLHLACLQGHTDVVRVLLEAGADVDARNSSLWTPLDCASAKGHVFCVHELLDYDSPIDPIDKTKTTPLQLAAKEGHVAVTRLLLERGASLQACDTSGRNALELAIAAGKKDVCMAIVKSSDWEMALKNVRTDYKGRRVTPFRMLIKKFPDVAEAVLNRCTKSNGMDSDDERYAMLFKFDLVDDNYIMSSNGSDTDSIASISSMETPYDEDGRVLEDARLYTSDFRDLKKNHPLMLMVKYKRLNLLNHPVSISLVKHKWMSYGRFVYYSTLIFYSIFLTFLTGYVLTAKDWAWVEEQLADVPNGDILAQEAVASGSCEDIKDKVDLTSHGFVVAGKWVIIVMAAINILREIFQIYQARLNYIGLENLMEWCCYITAFLLVWDFTNCSVREKWQWQVGTASIFLAWMNLLLFIRKLPFLGIYVVMFTDVFATFLRFLTVFLLFLIAFGLCFFMVLRNQLPFGSLPRSLLKTGVMTIGEFEYDSVFNDSTQTLPYPEVTYIVFVTFLALMSILIMNLLVGLAVDDIKAVQDQAILKRLAMQTQLVLDVEVFIPDALRRMYTTSKKEVHPNARHGILSKKFGDFQVLKSFEVVSDGEMSEQESMRQDLTQLKTTVEALRSQNQRLHSLLVVLTSMAKGDSSSTKETDLAKLMW